MNKLDGAYNRLFRLRNNTLLTNYEILVTKSRLNDLLLKVLKHSNLNYYSLSKCLSKLLKVKVSTLYAYLRNTSYNKHSRNLEIIKILEIYLRECERG